MTARELEIVALVIDGLSNREIGERLAISARTVQSHLAATMRKLHAKTRTQVAVAALRAGLVAIDGSLEGGVVGGRRVEGDVDRAASLESDSADIASGARVDASSSGAAPVSRWACQLHVRSVSAESSGGD